MNVEGLYSRFTEALHIPQKTDSLDTYIDFLNKSHTPEKKGQIVTARLISRQLESLGFSGESVHYEGYVGLQAGSKTYTDSPIVQAQGPNFYGMGRRQMRATLVRNFFKDELNSSVPIYLKNDLTEVMLNGIFTWVSELIDPDAETPPSINDILKHVFNTRAAELYRELEKSVPGIKFAVSLDSHVQQITSPTSNKSQPTETVAPALPSPRLTILDGIQR